MPVNRCYLDRLNKELAMAEHNFHRPSIPSPENIAFNPTELRANQPELLRDHPVFAEAIYRQNTLKSMVFPTKKMAVDFTKALFKDLDQEAYENGMIGQNARLYGSEIHVPAFVYQDDGSIDGIQDTIKQDANEVELEPPSVKGKFIGFNGTYIQISASEATSRFAPSWIARLSYQISIAPANSFPLIYGSFCAHGDLDSTRLEFAKDAESIAAHRATDDLLKLEAVDYPTLSMLDRLLSSENRYAQPTLFTVAQKAQGILERTAPPARRATETSLATLIKARLGIDGQQQFELTSSCRRTHSLESFCGREVLIPSYSRHQEPKARRIEDIVFLSDYRTDETAEADFHKTCTPYFAIPSDGLESKVVFVPIAAVKKMTPVEL